MFMCQVPIAQALHGSIIGLHSKLQCP